MALNDQEQMFWMMTDEKQPKQVFRGAEKLIKLDDIYSPTLPFESLCEPKIVFN